MDLYTKSQLHGAHNILNIYNYVVKILSLYPTASFPNNKSRNMNKGLTLKDRRMEDFSLFRHDKIPTI